MDARPSGDVTFLFTDIEGSTRLWEGHPEAMRGALARHDALMRGAIAAHGGHVFKTIGDAFCAAFASAPAALEAALEAQRALLAQPWPPETPVRVRMALHPGVADERDGDYFGPPLNRVARLLAAGHGGQILVSDVGRERAAGLLPEGTSLRSLGEHRLKDLSRSERIYQLAHPALPTDFPPLRSLDSRDLPNNLPVQVTSFVGRERELVQVKNLLTGGRMLTLTGPGGCGKTRLCLQVAAELVEHYPDGVWLVELASLADPDEVPAAVAAALGVKESPERDALEALKGHLRGRCLLLILDNCEHLLDPCARLADALLRTCPALQVLASSREALGISGETAYVVPPMACPEPGRPPTLDDLAATESVRLFVERALGANPAFAVTGANAAAVASVCRRLDGIPLAIELAAVRVRAMPVEDIDRRLDDRFRLLTGGSRAALPRQRTLRSLIDWSYDLLGDSEKALLRRLSVFAGGWDLESAEAVCGDAEIAGWEVLDLLTSLVDKSLVVFEERGTGIRYRFLETVRQYARERLIESDAPGPWRDRHLAHFAALAQEAGPRLGGAEQQVWLERLETEHDNLRAALEWSWTDPVRAESGLRMTGALWWFWMVRGDLREGRQRLARTLEAGAAGDPAIRAKALIGAGHLASHQGDHAAAKAALTECLPIFRELGDRRGAAYALLNLGAIAHQQGDDARAQSLYGESLALFRELGDRRGIGNALNCLGAVADALGDRAASRAIYAECLPLFRELGDLRGVANALHGLGAVAGEPEEVHPLYRECLSICHELGDRQGLANALDAMGALAARGGTFPVAARLWGAAEALRESVGAARMAREARRLEPQIRAARAALGEDAFDDARVQGAALETGAAVALALSLESPSELSPACGNWG